MHSLRTFATAWVLSLGTIAFFGDAVGSGNAAFAGETIAWRTDLEAARTESAESNRPMLLFVTSSHCPYCVKMMNDTFRNPAVIAELNEHFVPMQIERGTQAELERKIGIQLYPTIVIVDDVGVEVRRMKGFISGPAFVQSLKKIEAEWLAARPRPGTTVK